MATTQNPNVADRHDQTLFVGPIGNGTTVTGPTAVTDAAGGQPVIAAEATDATTTQALANSIRTILLNTGIAVAS